MLSTRLGALAAVLLPLAGTGTATADGATTVVLDGRLRHCDFSTLSVAPMRPVTTSGTGVALVRRAGSQAIADVRLVAPAAPGTHFDVGLIQAPRPASANCGPGDPGTAFTGMDTDGTGSGSVTVQDGIRSGTTGVWVVVERPNANSQNPAEFYTSEFVAPV
jgi:hypothetical protein